MLIYYLLLLFALLLLSGQFAMNKLFQSQNGSAMSTSLLYTTVSGLLTAALFFVVNGFTIAITPFSLLCASVIALLCLAYTLLGFLCFSMGSYAVFTTFLMSGGMLLPFVFGMIWLGDAESMSAVTITARIVGAILLTASLAFPCLNVKNESKTGKEKRGLFLAICLCVFFFNGFVSIFSKLHQISTEPIVDANSFVLLSNLLNGIFSGIALLIVSLTKKQPPQLAKGYPIWQLLVTALVYAVCNGGSYLLQLMVAASPLPASVQYPFVTGGSVVLSAVVGYLFFREKQNKLGTVGIALTFASTLLFLL